MKTQRKAGSGGGLAAVDCRIAMARDGAEREMNGWTEEAAQALREFSRTVANFTIEEARVHVADRVGEPSERRAWGAVALWATRRRWIERTGQFRVDSYGSPKTVYRAGVNA